MAEDRKTLFKGEGNHQYGLKGDKNASFKGASIKRRNGRLFEDMVYVGEWYKGAAQGRVKQHRFLVEQNYNLFPSEFFEEIDGWHYLKPLAVVHHIDGNHGNHSLENLQVMWKGQHVSLHNKLNPVGRDNISGRFVKRSKI